MVLELLEQLKQENRYSDIRRLGDELLKGLKGDTLARVLLSLAKAFEMTASCPADYRQALAYAQAAVSAAEQGGLIHTWALHRVACYLADFGLYKPAGEFAEAFMRALPRHERAQAVLPWVLYALGRVRANAGRLGEAVRLYRQAQEAAPADLSERIQLAKVWALAQAGDVAGAMAACPATVEHTHESSLTAARAVILAAAGDWSGAAELASKALPGYDQAPVYDVVEAAELCLILKRAAELQGRFAVAIVWALHTAALLRRWNAGLIGNLLPTLRPEGGVFSYAAASRCGSAGCKRTGLRGVVG